MAADNYSDVVQALAQQIVNTCSKLINAKAPALISSANIDASQITGDASIINAGGGGGGPVSADSVVGLNQAIADAIAGSTIDVDQIVKFDENVGLIVKKASIDTAQINKLEAYIADISKAHIGDADIDWAKIRSLAAEVAKIANAQIGEATIDVANVDWANIDWAKIKNSVTDRAIITQGVSGQLYIADLAVTEANMVSLTVGELMVKGSDGHFYSISVGEDGEIVKAQKVVGTDDIAKNAIVGDKIANETINGDAKLIGGSITARTLNVKDIFADSAIIRQLMAANIDVDTLFGREATLAKINTLDISGNQYLRLGVENYINSADGTEQVSGIAQTAVIAMDDDSIAAKVMKSEQFAGAYSTTEQVGEMIDDITVGGRNYIRNSKDMILEGTHQLVIFENKDAVGYAIVGASIVW